ncbi:MAG: UDP-N-acetylmuramoyl-tripeptide--D-alanyl-D-alanine ligase [Bacteroidales bacterium]|nr:UDP-N-acetylmuramoyl-tripeptide--D-alanyl-D-alanine ligase [Bacteroidales bacterium]
MFDYICSCAVECGCRVVTDNRAVKGGEMFFGIKGENCDGSDYAEAALKAGAKYAVINRGSKCAGISGTIEVEDTLETLKQLGIWNRRRFGVPVVGLTGTNGKTTTKELIRAVLAKKYRVTATEGNLNSDIGVPISLLRIDGDTEVAVIEMGANHPDDIAKLVEIVEPDMGLITNVGRAHLLGFGSFEGVKAAKGRLYDYLVANDRPIFLNEDDADLVGMVAERQGASVVPYGAEYEGVDILPATTDEPFLRFVIDGVQVNTRLVGGYNVNNALAAICVGRYFEVTLEDAAEAISKYEPNNKRSQMVRTEKNILIVDAYNANPSSMAAAVRNFALVESQKKVALLGEMRELGTESEAEHRKVVELLKEKGVQAILVGEEFARVSGGDFEVFLTSEALAAELEKKGLEGWTVLLKGSRGVEMEKVIKSL